MKLQIENNSSSDFMDKQDLSSDVSSANGSAEVTEMLRKGIKAAQDGNRAEARHLLMQATELEPKNENAWLWLASISEYPEELLIFLSNVLNINPNNERALEWETSTKALLSKTFVQRGIEASKESQSAFAKQCFLQAIVHDDKNEMAWLWLASITNEIEEKKSHLQKVLIINPNNETALASLKSVKNEMAQILLRKAQVEVLSGEKDSAQKMLGDIFNYAPEMEEAWMLKSFLTDSFSEKLSYFEKVLEFNPESETAASCVKAMKSVLESTEPKPDSGAVKEFELNIESEEEEKETVLEFKNEEDSESIKMPEEALAEPVNDEDISVEKYYSTKETANFPTQDYSVSEETAQQAESAESFEENSPQQEESVEEEPEMQVEASEEHQDEEHQDEESEMHLAFSEVVNEEENVFETIQHEVEFVEEKPEAVQMTGEMPSYEDVIEEAKVFEEEQKTEEVQYVEEVVEEDFPAQEAVEENVSEPETLEETVSEQEFQQENVSEQDVWDESIEVSEEPSFENSEAETVSFKEESDSTEVVQETAEVSPAAEEPAAHSEEEKPKAEMIACPFCEAENERQDFKCHSCRAMLTLSDLEMLLAHQETDMMTVQQKVEQMEIENSITKFDAEGLKMLGIGFINLKNLRKGFEYLQEAAHINPNDVLLNSQVNSLAIRMAEIEAKNSKSDSTPKNKTILVVDDSATVRKLISGKLEKSGHEVVCAVDGMDALEKINESIPDLILLDITMPRMDGYQVCKLIRGNDATKEVPVVMISGKDGFFDKVRGRMAGTTGYITKPFGPETLMKTVEAYID